MDTKMDSIPNILTKCRTVAVVGLSADPARPSHGVAQYMQAHGYRVIPVNPKYAGTHILGEHCYASLSLAAKDLDEGGIKIDIVDCFRKSDAIEPIAEEAIAIGALCLWMQIGVVNEKARAAANSAGLAVVMDRCLKIEHGRTA